MYYFYSNKYHVVWCPKCRRKVLVGDVELRLKEIIHDVCAEKQAELIEIECDKDHIHLLVEADPQYGIHCLIKQMKGRSGRLLRQEFKHLTTKLPTLWTNAYFVSTVGDAPVKTYRFKLYNHLIALHKRYYKLTGKYISKTKMQNHLPKLKNYNRFKHWKIVGSQAIQQINLRIDFGYQKFFKHENKRPPSFRKMRKFRSFTLTQAGWKLNNDNSVKIGGKIYKFWKSQEILGKSKLIHIVRDRLGDFYICIVTDFEGFKPDYATSIICYLTNDI